jgi:hypothetical protein
MKLTEADKERLFDFLDWLNTTEEVAFMCIKEGAEGEEYELQPWTPDAVIAAYEKELIEADEELEVSTLDAAKYARGFLPSELAGREQGSE